VKERQATATTIARQDTGGTTERTVHAASATRSASDWPRLRVAVASGVGLALLWLIATTTLPLALARSHPEWALWLSPTSPAALLVLARRDRRELLALTGVSTATAAKDAVNDRWDKDDVATPGRFAAPGLTLSEANHAKRIIQLRARIAKRAKLIIANDPLNATAFRMLAEVSDDPERVRQLMQAAVARSRRESVAVFWLLNDTFNRGEFDAAIAHAEALARMTPRLSSFAYSYLWAIARDKRGRELVIARLSEQPFWRHGFFSAMPRHTSNPAVPLELIAELRARGAPVDNRELRPYLRTMVAKGQVAQAYQVWLQSLPSEKLAGAGFLNNAEFAALADPAPFDWQVETPVNASAEMVAVEASDAASERNYLRVSFGVGRVDFPGVVQTIVLPPGAYTLAGLYRGRTLGKRGMRWRVSCLYGPRIKLGQTEMLRGSHKEPERWQAFSVTFSVPERSDCVGQDVRLTLDARSASEQLISGALEFSALRMQRAAPPLP